MNVAILVFSPSKSTLKTASALADSLRQREVGVQLVDITGSKQVFGQGDLAGFLATEVGEHDVLCVAGPVYAHHLQYHVQDLIRALPGPGHGWGRLAVPLVTYGGITSGIALEEAGKLLRRSGRTVVTGMKVTAAHCMTEPILGYEYNAGEPNGSMRPVVEELAERIAGLQTPADCADVSGALKYQSRVCYLKANIIFKEKVWHEKRYPQLRIDNDKCESCGKCVRRCPVRHLAETAQGIVTREDSPCIHCLACLKACPEQAVSLEGDLERGKEFMGKMIAKKGNTELPPSAVYPLSPVGSR